jgi:hypothetical protein
MATGGLFQVENPIKAAQQGLGMAGQTLAQMQRKGGGTSVTQSEGPGKSVGGALGSGAGLAISGAKIGTAIAPGIGTAIGAGAGAVIGLASYFLS